MPHYKSDEEVEKEFNEKFGSPTSIPKFSVWNGKALAFPGMIKQFIRKLRQADRQAVRLETLEEVEKNAPLEMCYCCETEECLGQCMTYHDVCRSEFLSKITKLKEIKK